MYRIPPIAFGQPLFDVDECIDFITVNFKTTGIDVENLGGGKMMVNWIKVARAPKKKQRNRAKIMPSTSLASGNRMIDNNSKNYNEKMNDVANIYRKHQNHTPQSQARPKFIEPTPRTLPTLPPPIATRTKGQRAVFKADRSMSSRSVTQSPLHSAQTQPQQIHPLTHNNTRLHNHYHTQKTQRQPRDFDTISLHSVRSTKSNVSTSTARHLDVLDEFMDS